MLCLPHLAPQATSDGVHMNTVKTPRQSGSDVQGTKVHANQNSYRTFGTSFALSFNSLRLGTWEEECRAI